MAGATIIPVPGSYESALKDAELVVRRINAGVDGFNRWSFLNRGDLDGQWQFIETWDRRRGKLLKQYTPHPNTYFVLGLLSRFTAKHSDVLGCRVDGGRKRHLAARFRYAPCAAPGEPHAGRGQRREDRVRSCL